jgi:hypothetical protein
MTVDLETLKTEILAYLDKTSFAVFHGLPGVTEQFPVFWDVERRPDFGEFLSAAEKTGTKLVVFEHRQFSLRQIDELLDQLEEADFTREEKRSYSNRIREIQKYEGFTCSLELSFSYDGRVFLYQQQTDWYRNWQELLEEIGALVDEQDEDDGADAIGGYFSKN